MPLPTTPSAPRSPSTPAARYSTRKMHDPSVGWHARPQRQIGRLRYRQVKYPYGVACKASALSARKREQVECPYRVACKASALGAGNDIPKSAYYHASARHRGHGESLVPPYTLGSVSLSLAAATSLTWRTLQSDKICHIDIQDGHIDTVISHIDTVSLKSSSISIPSSSISILSS